MLIPFSQFRDIWEKEEIDGLISKSTSPNKFSKMQSKKSFCIVLLKWQEQHTCPPVCNCIKFLIIYVCSIHIMCKSVEYMARNMVMMNLFPTFFFYIFCPFLSSKPIMVMPQRYYHIIVMFFLVIHWYAALKVIDFSVF